MGKIHGFRLKRRRRSGYKRYIRPPPMNRARSISRIFNSLKKKAMSFCSCKPSNSRRGYVPLNNAADDDKLSVPPKGYMAVYVGQRDGGGDGFHEFTIPVIYLNHPLFGELLRESQDEFGFNHPGKITIPCKVSDFENVQTRIAAAAGGRRKLTKW
ncbi:auxin-responsive protein SAUR36-like [Impatiens glandulifera]|uniref:auxin-responsive protein SAUR36-like n=1 Tax=Impatiens glandulifera TaxID=253017 RepID=UPI001FB17FB8|nr:auxin-responsive protein SAUR36-like [Impatiens glandulifera]